MTGLGPCMSGWCERDADVYVAGPTLGRSPRVIVISGERAEQLAPEHGGTGPVVEDGGLAPWAPSKLYEQAYPASFFEALNAYYERTGQPNPWAPPEDATPEQLAEMEA